MSVYVDSAMCSPRSLALMMAAYICLYVCMLITNSITTQRRRRTQLMLPTERRLLANDITDDDVVRSSSNVHTSYTMFYRRLDHSLILFGCGATYFCCRRQNGPHRPHQLSACCQCGCRCFQRMTFDLASGEH